MAPIVFFPLVSPHFLASYSMPAISPDFLVGGGYMALLLAGVLVGIVLLVRLLTAPPDWSVLTENLRSRCWQIPDALRIMLIFVLLQVFTAGLHLGAVKLRLVPGGDDEISAVFIQGMLFQVGALLTVAYFIRRHKSSWSGAFGMTLPGLKQSVGQGLGCYIGLMPVILVTSILYQLFLYVAGYPVTMQDVVAIFMEPHSVWSLLLLLLMAVVFAPLAEEALFRGILMPALMKKTGAGAAVAISSALFALSHMHLPSLVPLFVLSIALSLLYIYSGSLWSAVMLHAVFNGISIGILLLACPG